MGYRGYRGWGRGWGTGGTGAGVGVGAGNVKLGGVGVGGLVLPPAPLCTLAHLT